MDSSRTKSHLNAKYMRLPEEKFILHVCLTFWHHYTTRPHFGKDISELQGKPIINRGPSRKVAAPVSSGQFPRQTGRANLTPDTMERNFNPFLQEVSRESYDQD